MVRGAEAVILLRPVRVLLGTLAFLALLPVCAVLISAAWLMLKASPAPLIEPRYNTNRWEA